MERIKIYLDTSVISHLQAPDAPEKQKHTQTLWAKFKNSAKYEIIISPVTFIELLNCPEPKQTFMWRQLRMIPHTMIDESDEAKELALKYLKVGVLPPKCVKDSQHIAYAVVNECDVIISWNFKHFVSEKTTHGVKIVNALSGYSEMSICSPEMFLEGGFYND